MTDILSQPLRLGQHMKNTNRLRYKVRAWGSIWPDINYETEDVPAFLSRYYPNVDIQRIEPVSREEIVQSMKDAVHAAGF